MYVGEIKPVIGIRTCHTHSPEECDFLRFVKAFNQPRQRAPLWRRDLGSQVDQGWTLGLLFSLPPVLCYNTRHAATAWS